jgi:hypothetical protein
MTAEELSEALDVLSERLAIRGITRRVIQEAADSLEKRLSLSPEEQHEEKIVG